MLAIKAYGCQRIPALYAPWRCAGQRVFRGPEESRGVLKSSEDFLRNHKASCGTQHNLTEPSGILWFYMGSQAALRKPEEPPGGSTQSSGILKKLTGS